MDIVTTNIRLFADDTSLYVIINNPDNDALQLNLDLQSMLRWSKMWLVDFNPNKTNHMIISRKVLKPNHPQLTFNNTVLNDVSSHKHLGMYLSNDGSWHAHILYITDKGWKGLQLMR